MIPLAKSTRLLQYAAALVLAAFTLAMLVPIEYIPVDPQYDKLQHVGFFVLITVCLYVCISTKLWIAAITATAIAVLSESVQVLLPYRSGSIDDLWADLIGISLSCMSIFIFLCIKRSLKP